MGSFNNLKRKCSTLVFIDQTQFAYNSIKLYFSDGFLSIPWKKISRGLPRGKRYADDRAPTIEEIRRILKYPDRRIKPIVLTVSSCGFRLGSWDYLKWRNVHPIRRGNQVIAAKLVVYGGDDDEYFSFITPEAYHSINDWMTYRRECGELINEDSWVMRNLWNSTTTKGKGSINNPRNLKSAGVKQLMQRALFAQGLRKKLEQGKKRHEFQANHAFRKWFKTRCEMAGMKPINVEVLMGHSTGISDSYYRATENELLEDYLKAVDFLTIDDKHTIAKQLSDLEEKKNIDITQLNQDLHEKSREIEVLHKADTTKDDAIAALSDKLQSLMEEVENLKKRK